MLTLLVAVLVLESLALLAGGAWHAGLVLSRRKWRLRTEACEDVIEKQANELTTLARSRKADAERLNGLLVAARTEYAATLEQVRRDYEAARRDAETLRQDAQLRERARGEAEAVWAKQRAEVADLARTMLAYVERP